MNAYNQAVKLWNTHKKTIIAEHVYAMPKKGTIEHGQVMAIAKKIIEGTISDEIVKEIIRTHKTPYVAPKKERKPRTKKEKAVAALEVAAEAAPEPVTNAPPPVEKKTRKPRTKKEKVVAAEVTPEPVSEPIAKADDDIDMINKAFEVVKDLTLLDYRRLKKDEFREAVKAYEILKNAKDYIIPDDIMKKIKKIKIPKRTEKDAFKLGIGVKDVTPKSLALKEKTEPVEKKKRESKKEPEPMPEPEKEDTDAIEELEKAVKYVRDLPARVYGRFAKNKKMEVMEMYRVIADAMIDMTRKSIPAEIRNKIEKLTKGIKIPTSIEKDIAKSDLGIVLPTAMKSESNMVKKRKRLDKLIAKTTKAEEKELPIASEIADAIKAPVKSAVKTIMRDIKLPGLRDK